MNHPGPTSDTEVPVTYEFIRRIRGDHEKK